MPATNRRAHNWHIRQTHCTFCNAPYSVEENERGHCRGGLKHGKAKEWQKRKAKRTRKRVKHEYRKSRFCTKDQVWSITYARAGVVVGHVRRKRPGVGCVQWRQCPVVRFEDPVGQHVHDDTELTRDG